MGAIASWPASGKWHGNRVQKMALSSKLVCSLGACMFVISVGSCSNELSERQESLIVWSHEREAFSSITKSVLANMDAIKTIEEAVDNSKKADGEKLFRCPICNARYVINPRLEHWKNNRLGGSEFAVMCTSKRHKGSIAFCFDGSSVTFERKAPKGE